MSKKLYLPRGLSSILRLPHHGTYTIVKTAAGEAVVREEVADHWWGTKTYFLQFPLPEIEDCEEEAPQPPKWAEFFLTALACSRHAEAAIGDLNERFAGECEQFGAKRAARLYWARTARSIVPLLLRAVGKVLK